MIKTGDLVMLKNAKIRGPDGTLKDLPESPDYGVVIGLNLDVVGGPLAAGADEAVCRVMWFDYEGGVRRGHDSITLEFVKDIVRLSR